MRPFHATTTPSRSWRAFGPFLMAAALLCLGDAAQAQAAAGTVTHLSGLLTARRDDGSTRLLAARSVVHEGETLVTGADTYMEVQFLDDGTLMMGPDSEVQVTRYSWNPDSPAADRVLLELQRGTLRSETGQLGKRNHDAIRIKVPGGQIEVHGTTFVAQSVPTPPVAGPISPGALAPAYTPTTLAPGLYVQVLDGLITVSNPSGTTNFAAGQFGYTPNIQQPPVLVPANPAMQFTPPPAFSATPSGSSTANKSGTVDCEVR
jgi:hypothetical protein